MEAQRPSRLTILIAAFIVLVVIVILSTFLFSSSSTKKAATKVSPSPAPTLTSTDYNDQPSPTGIQFSEDQKILLERFENRELLSANDTQAVEKILSLLPQKEESGIIYASGNIHIEYVKSADIFQVEILTTDVAKAKTEGNAWFIEHNISQKGICEYPVQFYLNFEVKQQLRGTNTDFSPLAPGC